MSTVVTGILNGHHSSVGISFSITGGDRYDVTPDGDKWPHYRWTGKFRFEGRTLQVGHMRGLFLPGAPKPQEILASAFSDAESVRFFTFEGWAAEMGRDRNDPDEWKKAKRIYNACERMNDRLGRFFGSATERDVWFDLLEEWR